MLRDDSAGAALKDFCLASSPKVLLAIRSPTTTPWDCRGSCAYWWKGLGDVVPHRDPPISIQRVVRHADVGSAVSHCRPNGAEMEVVEREVVRGHRDRETDVRMLAGRNVRIPREGMPAG